jgi:alpha-beta hydrolase superfamily lysophospholipase
MKKGWKYLLRTLLVLFVLANVMAFFHARKFTHFDPDVTERVDPSKVSFMKKAYIMFTGVSLPRPKTKVQPDRPFTTVQLKSNVSIVCWEMKAERPKGTVVLCHGYGGEKSDMLGRAYMFVDSGYNVLLPDFMGAGASGGNECTIGYKEAENVKTCVYYLRGKGEKNIYLMGSSMGAVAIMRAASIYNMPVKALVLECPFGSMRQTVKNRFEMVGFPAFPLSDMLVFWGGVQNGFNAFSHNPEDYAKKIKLPVLLLSGGIDDRVKRFEIDDIYFNLACKKQLIRYPLAGHESYLNKYRAAWTADVCRFLSEN